MSRHAKPVDRWFCVEDCGNPRRPVLLLESGTLQECHEFIEQCRHRGRLGVFRVNYSSEMRRYLSATTSQAA